MKYSSYEDFCLAILEITNKLMAAQMSGLKTEQKLLILIGNIHEILNDCNVVSDNGDLKIKSAVGRIKNTVSETLFSYGLAVNKDNLMSSSLANNVFSKMGLQKSDLEILGFQENSKSSEQENISYQNVYFWSSLPAGSSSKKELILEKTNQMMEFCE